MIITTSANTNPSHAPTKGPHIAAPITIGIRPIAVEKGPKNAVYVAKHWKTTTRAVISEASTKVSVDIRLFCVLIINYSLLSFAYAIQR